MYEEYIYLFINIHLLKHLMSKHFIGLRNIKGGEEKKYKTGYKRWKYPDFEMYI